LHEVNLSAINSEVKENFKKKRDTHMSLFTHIYWVTLFSINILYFDYQRVCCVATITQQPVTTNIKGILMAHTEETSTKTERRPWQDQGESYRPTVVTSGQTKDRCRLA